MAQLLTAGALGIVGTIAGAGVIYFQPHSVIALLVRGFPRIIWCLSHASPPLRTSHNSARRRSATDTPSDAATSKGWERFNRRLKIGKKRATRLYGMVVGAIGSAVASASSGLRGTAYAEPGMNEAVVSSTDTELEEYHFEEGEDEEEEEAVADLKSAKRVGLLDPSGSFTAASGSLSGSRNLDVEAEEERSEAEAMEEGRALAAASANMTEESLHSDAARVPARRFSDHEDRLPGVSQPVVALTIDDSPSIYSAEMLDILKENGCNATFFIIGNHVEKLDDGEAILSRMTAEGHELGNHTWYDRPTIRLPNDVFEQELLRVDALISKHSPTRELEEPHLHTTGEGMAKKIKWFRPGQGWFTHEMCDTAERHGYRTVLGCRFPLDTASPDPQLNAWHVIQGIHPGAIVVLHDARERIKQTLRILLPTLIQMGYRVVTISELYRLACVGSGEVDERGANESEPLQESHQYLHHHHHHHHHHGSCEVFSPAPPLPPRRRSSGDILSSPELRLSRSLSGLPVDRTQSPSLPPRPGVGIELFEKRSSDTGNITDQISAARASGGTSSIPIPPRPSAVAVLEVEAE
ncbi:hypothetical protein HDU67_008755 [Dinochytrium kinnereticum]|nr:hypothetical protein HDU67_008755 [Dinochytrium kinnereticum]